VGAEIVPVGLGEFVPDSIVEDFRGELMRGADAVVINHVSNVFGYIQPINEIAEICREFKVPLIVDASQSAGCVPVNMKKLGAAFVACPGHKGLYGPQGTGLLVCGDTPVVPLLRGGSGSDSLLTDMPDYLPDRLEAGTHNTPGIAGLSAGIKYVLDRGESAVLNRERSLINCAAKGLKAIPGIIVYDRCGITERAGVLSFNVSGMDAEKVGGLFSDMGIALRSGLHCAPLAHKAAGTLSGGTVRMSVSDFTGKREVDTFLNAAEHIALVGKRKSGIR
jgi:selenocysteine lyase/cysteine desulfurase